MITPKDLREWKACYYDEKIAAIFAATGKESLTLTEVLELDTVPAEDRIWVACHYLARHDQDTLVAFARYCADNAFTYDAGYAAYAAERAADAVDAVHAVRVALDVVWYLACASSSIARTAAYAKQIEWLLKNAKESGK